MKFEAHTPTLWVLVTVLSLIWTVSCSPPPNWEIRPPGSKPSYLVGDRGRELEIDGKLDDIAWSHIPSSGRLTYEGPKAPSNQTRFRATIDDELFYVVFLCEGDSLVTKDHVGVRVLSQDGQSFLEVQVTLEGASSLTQKTLDGYSRPADGDVLVAVSAHNNRWITEIGIPRELLPPNADRNDVWHADFFRRESDVDRTQHWVPSSNPPHPSFGRLEFLGAPLP